MPWICKKVCGHGHLGRKWSVLDGQDNALTGTKCKQGTHCQAQGIRNQRFVAKGSKDPHCHNSCGKYGNGSPSLCNYGLGICLKHGHLFWIVIIFS